MGNHLTICADSPEILQDVRVYAHPEWGDIRAIERNGEAWLVAADVCRVLDIGNSRDALTRLDDDEKAAVGITDTSSNGVRQARKMNIINEPGFYRLVFTSRKPEAKAFQRWVTHDVLPAVVHTGSYTAPGAAPQVDRDTLRSLVREELAAERAGVQIELDPSGETGKGYFHPGDDPSRDDLPPHRMFPGKYTYNLTDYPCASAGTVDYYVFTHPELGRMRMVMRIIPLSYPVYRFKPWFVAEDVCRMLNVKDGAQVFRKLDHHEKDRAWLYKCNTSGISHRFFPDYALGIVTERGLFSVIVGAKKDKRYNAFRRWFDNEVLPECMRIAEAETKPYRDAVAARDRYTI